MTLSQNPFVFSLGTQFFPLGHSFLGGTFSKRVINPFPTIHCIVEILLMGQTFGTGTYYRAKKILKIFKKIMSLMSHNCNLARKVGTFWDNFFPLYVRGYKFYSYRITKEILGHFFWHLGQNLFVIKFKKFE
jgi:hypothetical protein